MMIQTYFVKLLNCLTDCNGENTSRSLKFDTQCVGRDHHIMGLQEVLLVQKFRQQLDSN